MLSTIDRPPILPPINRGEPRPRREVWIVPDIHHFGTYTKTQHDNCWTVHHVWMSRIWGFLERIEIAHVNSRTYRQWLELHPESFDMGVPPHIQFGGAVVAGKGDPEFKARWAAYARRTFC